MNRVWNQYFGHGIVSTVSDFGKMGEKPTNPELLDYLADQFVKDGWSPKKLHRAILLSHVYRQSSDYREDANQADPENKLLEVFPVVRLDAEQIRDSALAAAGKLDTDTVGGPSVFPPVPQGYQPQATRGRCLKILRILTAAACMFSLAVVFPIRCSRASIWPRRKKYTASAT